MFWTKKKSDASIIEDFIDAFPPPLPLSAAKVVKDKMHEMLLSALKGGISYEDAKKACECEFGEELSAAQDHDKILMESFSKRMNEWIKRKEERDRERYNGS